MIGRGLSVGLAAAIAASLALAPAADSARTSSVTIGEYFFRSPRVQIDPGDSVTWTNRGKILHTVTSSGSVPERFNGGMLDHGESYTRTFAKPGTYSYICTLHPGLMGGTVQVGPDKVRPRLAAPRVKVGSARLRVALSLSERSSLSLRVTKAGRTVSRRTVKPLIRGRRSFSIPAPRTAGSYRLSLVAVDAAHNRSKATSVRFRVR